MYRAVRASEGARLRTVSSYKRECNDRGERVDGRAKTKTEDKYQIPDKLAATAARLKADNQVAVLSSTRVTAFGHVISPNGFN